MDAQRLGYDGVRVPPRIVTNHGALTVSAQSLTTPTRPVWVMVPVRRPWPGTGVRAYPAGYPETAAGRRRLNPVRYDRFPFEEPPVSVSGSFRVPCRPSSVPFRVPPFVPGVPGRAGSRGSGSDARKRVRNINRSGFTLPTHPGTTPETPTAESTCQESERVVV
jgi:hypothetical protein